MSILKYPFFEEVAPFMSSQSTVDSSGVRHHSRFEVKKAPQDLLQRALEVEIPCCVCGVLMHPFRRRKGPILRHPKKVPAIRGVYFAPCCSPKDNERCYHTKTVSTECTAILAALRAKAIK